ncbi:MAG: alpha-glucosidase/alpha-galactosidase [Rhodobacteraceae bacterium]|nr:MAG: alpha-glucosidase/alpha-galactosidase [Paracoccaceae bacterium]
MRKKITFIGAGSTIFIKNIIGDIFQFESLYDCKIALMDIDETRLKQSERVVKNLISSKKVKASIDTFDDQRKALIDSNFVVVAFQIGGYKPCTMTDFEIPKKYGLRQTIGDSLGIGGIMRGLRTVPYLWKLCEDMKQVCPEAFLLQYVNPMAINTWAIGERYPEIRQIGLCHSVQGTSEELAVDLGVKVSDLRYKVAGINHMAFYLELSSKQPDGSFKDMYPKLFKDYKDGKIPKRPGANTRCFDFVRYEFMKHFGYFVTESSEHFSEYVPWFIKAHRPDLISDFGIPLDEYPKRCEEQISEWLDDAKALEVGKNINHKTSHEYAASIMNALITGEQCNVYGNVVNRGYIAQLPEKAAVEVECIIDKNGIQPQIVKNMPISLIALIRSNINVQELVVDALLKKNRNSVYHAAMLDPHTAAELDLNEIRNMVDDLISEHGNWMPQWLQKKKK